MTLPETIVTERLTLRRPRPSDAEALFGAYTQDPEVTKYLMWRPHTSIADTTRYLAVCNERWEEGRECTWGLALAGTDTLIGMIACRPGIIKTDIGYVIARPYWGKGLMSEAGRAVVEAAFRIPTMYRVWATCDVDNIGSARVLEKIGMEREGVLRRWVVHPNISATPRDSLVYSIVR